MSRPAILPPTSSAPTILPLAIQAVSFVQDGHRLVDGIEAVLAAGPKTVILGPNGAGKSLLLRLCHGLIKPTAGRVLWGGPAAAEGLAAIARRQAMVFQRPVLLRRSAAGNVAYALKLRRTPETDEPIEGRVRAALALVGLELVANRAARLLSGGEQQRLALARAWAVRPEVLFLDEPTANLDPAATRAVETIIARFHEAGTKIIMTTHDLGQARRLADEVLFLDRGRLIERAVAPQFFAAPSSAAASAFLEGELID
jgi:tungstate transport system ATP-binding protein